MGRNPEYKPEYDDIARKLCLLGHTDAELAAYFEVSETTINNWKIQYPSFLESLKDGKERADIKVTEGLYKRACDNDTTAAIFWLKNRQPKKWRDKQVVESTTTHRVIMTDDDGKAINPQDTDL